jgi:hypothetical protein
MSLMKDIPEIIKPMATMILRGLSELASAKSSAVDRSFLKVYADLPENLSAV